MVEYKDLKTGTIISAGASDKAGIPSAGTKILLKTRPPTAIEVSSD